MRTTTIAAFSCLLLLPGLLFAASPEKPKTIDANVVNEPTVHVGSNVDANVVNEPIVHVGSNVDVNVVNIPSVDAAITNQPTVHIGSSVDVNAYQAGEWSLSVASATRDLREFTGNFGSADGWIEVFQVPEGRRFILTDIYLNQRIYGAWHNTVSLNRNAASNVCGVGSSTFMYTHLLGLQAGERNQVHYPLKSGYEFTSGERICVAQSGGGLIFYNLSGFEVDD